jgi:hypothetical protein
MDYAFDYYFEQNYYNQNMQISYFIYDDKRFFSKLYVLLKFIGILFYTITLYSCKDYDYFIFMIIIMSLSMINSFRYEYAHYKRYNTIFSSIDEYKIWKNKLYPKSRIFFSFIEASIKIIFFIITFPPQFDFRNLCEIGTIFFRIHILVLFMIYILAGILSICFLCLIHYNDYSNNRETRIDQIIISKIKKINNNQNEECCICLDISNINDWSLLECGHKFHHSCILLWIRTNQTCPVCRTHL